MEMCVISNTETGEVKMFIEINQAMTFMELPGNTTTWTMEGLYYVQLV